MYVFYIRKISFQTYPCIRLDLVQRVNMDAYYTYPINFQNAEVSIRKPINKLLCKQCGTKYKNQIEFFKNNLLI